MPSADLLQYLLQYLHENVSNRAHVKSVFGEPIAAADKTIVPVAKVAYMFGGGSGTGGVGEKSARGEGGGVRVIPVGVIEVSNQPTRFVPISDRRKLGGAMLVGVALGLLPGRRRRG